MTESQCLLANLGTWRASELQITGLLFKGFTLRYHNKETILFTIDPYTTPHDLPCKPPNSSAGGSMPYSHRPQEPAHKSPPPPPPTKEALGLEASTTEAAVVMKRPRAIRDQGARIHASGFVGSTTTATTGIIRKLINYKLHTLGRGASC